MVSQSINFIRVTKKRSSITCTVQWNQSSRTRYGTGTSEQALARATTITLDFYERGKDC